jgi:MFS family permease
MTGKNYRVYAYRWVILAVFMLINLTIQMLWICYAPITGLAARYYGVSDLQIGFLAMLFMIIYVPLSIPISWAIDTYGYRKAVGAGAVLLAVFGLLRGVFAANYTWVVICTLGLAAAQPFLLNAVTTVAARWFPMEERATAGGLALVAGFIGIAIGQVTSPMLVLRFGADGSGITAMQMIFGAVAALSAVVFLIFTREAPPTPPHEPAQDARGHEARALVLNGLKSMLRMRDIWLLLFLSLVGMGVFNGVSTWIEEIVRPKGFDITQAGELGGVMLVGGVLGAIVVPALSDRLHKRKIFLLVGMALAVPGLIGVIMASTYPWMMAAMFVLGFFLISLAPIAYQYAAEITYPAPEGTSNGLLNLAGQASVVFIFAMQALRDSHGAFTFSLSVFIVLMVMSGLGTLALEESRMVIATENVVEN